MLGKIQNVPPPGFPEAMLRFFADCEGEQHCFGGRGGVAKVIFHKF